MKQKWKTSIFAVICVILLVAADQITKFFAVKFLSPITGGNDIILWKEVFRLKYLENRGAAFGVMQGQKVFFVIITLIIIFALCWFFIRIPNEKRFKPLQILSVLIMSGAIGNFIDRLRLGYVIDFFYFELINFPIFNVADIYVTCSIFLFAFLFLFYYKDEELEVILTRKKRSDHGSDSGI